MTAFATPPAVATTSPWPEPVLGRLQVSEGIAVRHARWHAQGPVRGTVVLLHGRTEFLEKYAETAADWNRRGFDVFTFDWRGQGLSSRFDGIGQAGHVTDYSVYLDELRAFLDKVVTPAAPPGPWVLFGHSMGGHVGLRHLAGDDDRFHAAVFSAPMTDIHTGPFPRWAASRLAATLANLGLSERYAFGQGDYSAGSSSFEGNVLTSDPVRFRIHHDHYRDNPDLRVGGVTFGWLHATFRSVEALTAPGGLERIRIPTLFVIAPGDKVVPADSQRAVAARIKGAVVKDLPGSGHEPFIERDEIRNQAWEAIDGFLTGVPELSPDRQTP
ncbi:MAG TPA: alpha/beta hydrolase [Azospirillaceae bacterium]|nr:alpha/beta hydrolase [Azospirillaceae bacterium]